MKSDEFNLGRFVVEQEKCYWAVLRELRAGEKRSHWMWFIFPQMKGLGRSRMAEYFGIGSIAEARAYAAHAVLGARLRECTELVLAIENRTAHVIFNSPDDLKFCSCMTLFECVASDPQLFAAAIEKYFDGVRDQPTLDLLNKTE